MGNQIEMKDEPVGDTETGTNGCQNHDDDNAREDDDDPEAASFFLCVPLPTAPVG